MRRALVALLAVSAVATACRSTPRAESTLVVVVNAPFSRAGSIATVIANGAQLAIEEINAAGGVVVGDRRYLLRVRKLDTALSTERAVQNVRRAVDEGAVAIVDEGTGIDATWRVAAAAGIPIGIVYQGGAGLVDPEARPNVFRIAPTDRGIAFRLAEYLVPKGLRIAFVHDDSDYGTQGKRAFDQAFSSSRESVSADVEVSAHAPNLSAQILQARRSGATALLVWGLAPTIAETIRAARSSGWDVPVYTPPAGEDPLVRQQLADHPEWVDGLTFAGGRMTAEKGPGPFLEFARAYEQRFGRIDAGVTTSSGARVHQPPDHAMYPYDFVRVVAAALAAAGTPHGDAVVRAMERVDIHGANGDERGFNEINHEGVVDDDVCFSVFRDMTFAPVKDDPLSSTLPTIRQTGGSSSG